MRPRGSLKKLRQRLSCVAALALGCGARPEPAPAAHTPGERARPRPLTSAAPPPVASMASTAPALHQPAPSESSKPAAPEEPGSPELDAVRKCVAQDRNARLIFHPQPLYEAGGYNELLSQIRGKASHLSAKAARAALCRPRPEPALCASSDCQLPDASFIWLLDNEFEFRAALVVRGGDGKLRAYLAASGVTFNSDICLMAETREPNCSESGIAVERSDPTSAHVRLSYFSSAGRFCNGQATHQTWIFDDDGRASAWFIGTPFETEVTVSEGRVSVANRSTRCGASAPLSDFVNHPPSGERLGYF